MTKKLFQSDAVPLLVICIALITLLLVPLKVMGSGFLPPDDALRHVAKSISGKNWDDILVLRPGAGVDSHPGHHLLLGFIHDMTGCGKDALLSFSVIALFLLFCLIPLFFIKRPESWLAALFIITMTNFAFTMRLFFGRPLIMTMSAVTILCLIWPRFKEKKMPLKAMAFLTAVIAMSTWFHGSWYLFALPLICLALTGKWRPLYTIGICVGIGIIAGAALSGHPFLFLKKNLAHGFLSLGAAVPTRMLVSEFRPYSGDFLIVLSVALLLLWRYVRGARDPDRIADPVFALAALGWVLGLFVYRFWSDWGIPATLVWIALEFDDAFKNTTPELSIRRVIPAAFLAIALYGAVTADVDSRWSNQPAAQYLSEDSPETRSWMPASGGIVYSSDMRVFYLTFFKYPHAEWRYILGFEPGLMPDDDLAIFRHIQLTNDSPQSYIPWIKKMSRKDRLIIPSNAGKAPEIPGLEWRYAGSGFWIGRPS